MASCEHSSSFSGREETTGREEFSSSLDLLCLGLLLYDFSPLLTLLFLPVYRFNYAVVA